MASNDWVDIGSWLSDSDSSSGEPVTLAATYGVDEDGSSSIDLPLKSRKISARIDADLGVCEATETLIYSFDKDCSATFRFPLPPKSAVYKFEAIVDKRTIRTVTKKKQRARADYAVAVDQGHTAVLLEQKSTHIFSIKLGNLPATQNCEIRISYVALLDKVDNTLEYLHTSTWVPPYMSSGEGQEVDDTTPAFAAKVSYSVSYRVEIKCRAGVKRVVDTADKLDMQAPTENGKGYIVEQHSPDVVDPSRDFQLLIELNSPSTSEPESGSLVLQEKKESASTKRIVKATFTPSIAVTGGRVSVKKEMWLVVDCSGSMNGNPIAQAREAALFFVKDLPIGEGVVFNIAAFGSNHRFLYRNGCREYDSATQAEAVTWITDTLWANMGGTEILETLRAIYAIRPKQGYQRQIVFLTDGGIYGGQEREIYQLISEGAPQGRVTGVASKVKGALGLGAKKASDDGSSAGCQIFCLGIGAGVHRGLLDGMASHSNGVAAFVNDNENIAAKAGMLKKCALGSGQLLRPKLVGRGCVIAPVPAVLPPVLFPGQPLTVLAELLECADDALSSVALVLKADLPGGATWSQELKLAEALVHEGNMLGVLHAMGYVSALLSGKSHMHVGQDGQPRRSGVQREDMEEEVVRVATAENLVTPFTATVGVMCQEDPLDPTKVQEVDIPLQLPTGRSLWGTAPKAGLPFDEEKADMLLQGLQGNLSHMYMSPQLITQECSNLKAMAFSPTAMVQRSCYATQDLSMAASLKTWQPARRWDLGLSNILGRARSAAPAPTPTRAAAWPASGQVALCSSQASPAFRQAALCSSQASPAFSQAALCSSHVESSEGSDEDMAFSTFDADATLASEVPLPVSSGVAVTAHGRLMAPASSASAAPPGSLPTPLSPPGSLPTPLSPPTSCATPASAPPPPPSCATPASALRCLNLWRCVEGGWRMEAELLVLLAGAAGGPGGKGGKKSAEELRAARPQVLGEDEWATLLALAFLRKHLSGERPLWEGMAQKAELWLQSRWPENAAGMAGTILMAMKLL